jgi:tetratricopeptide (TPR) repeat protein
MTRRIKLAIASIATLLFLLLCGDYFNVPLWPVNLLNRAILLELNCQLDGYESSNPPPFIKNEDGITIEIRDRWKNNFGSDPSQIMKTDTTGLFHIHLPAGKYYVRAEIMSYAGDKLYHMATGKPGTFVEVIHDRNTPRHSLILKKLDLVDFIVLQSQLERFVKEGNLSAGKALLQEVLDIGREAFDSDQIARIHEQISQLDSLLSIANTYETLPEDRYLSRLDQLRKMSEGLRVLMPSIKPAFQRVLIRGQMVDLTLLMTSINEAVIFILGEYLNAMDRFMEIKQFQESLRFWLLLTKNPEISYDLLPLPNKDIFQRIELYRNSIPEVKKAIVGQLETFLSQGKIVYEQNDLDQAANYFQRCVLIKDEFQDELGLNQEMKTEIDTYLQDIQNLRLGHRFFELKDMQMAREHYQRVVHETKWLKVLKSDLAKHS